MWPVARQPLLLCKNFEQSIVHKAASLLFIDDDLDTHKDYNFRFNFIWAKICRLICSQTDNIKRNSQTLWPIPSQAGGAIIELWGELFHIILSSVSFREWVLRVWIVTVLNAITNSMDESSVSHFVSVFPRGVSPLVTWF